MAGYIADTNIWIDHLHNVVQATEFLASENIILPYIVKAELINGVRDKRELLGIEKSVKSFDLDSGGSEINRRMLKILSENRLKQGMSINDATIAAFAIERNRTLVTDNIKHFRGIEGLKLKKLSEVVK